MLTLLYPYHCNVKSANAINWQNSKRLFTMAFYVDREAQLVQINSISILSLMALSSLFLKFDRVIEVNVAVTKHQSMEHHSPY